MIICCVATHSDRYFPSLQDSCKKNKCNLKVLGWGEKWKGFGMKYRLMEEFVNNIDNNEIIMFVDAYDVVILQDSRIIENKFKSLNIPILFSIEPQPKSLIEHYLSKKQFSTCQNQFLNSGTYMGYCYAIKKFLSEIRCENDNCDDQINLLDLCNKSHYSKNLSYPYYKFLDIKKEIFLNCRDENHYRILRNKIYNYNNNYSPCVFHGYGYYNMDNIVNLYGYYLHCPYSYLNFIKYLYSLIKTSFKYFTIEIIIGLLFIVCIFILYMKKK